MRNFKNKNKMYECIASGTDLYNPVSETYIFLYNDNGAIAVYSNINSEKAKELSELSFNNGDYWGAFLGVGGQIYEEDDAINLCGDILKEGYWVDTNVYAKALKMKPLERQSFIDGIEFIKDYHLVDDISTMDFELYEYLIRMHKEVNL